MNPTSTIIQLAHAALSASLSNSQAETGEGECTSIHEALERPQNQTTQFTGDLVFRTTNHWGWSFEQAPLIVHEVERQRAPLKIAPTRAFSEGGSPWRPNKNPCWRSGKWKSITSKHR